MVGRFRLLSPTIDLKGDGYEIDLRKIGWRNVLACLITTFNRELIDSFIYILLFPISFADWISLLFGLPC